MINATVDVNLIKSPLNHEEESMVCPHIFVDRDLEIAYQKRKVSLLDTLLDRIKIGFAGPGASTVEIPEDKLREGINFLVRTQSKDVDNKTQERLVQDLLDEVHGLGPLETLMNDPSINDILVNNPYEVYAERRGCLLKTPIKFADGDHLVRIAQRVAARVGRRVDGSSPMVDARLADGSRLNVTLPPVAIDGATISIRRFPDQPYRLDELQEMGTLCSKIRQFLAYAVESKLSFLISGGTGAGKTTLLNALTENISPRERIVTVEDSAELKLIHPHVVRLECRLANLESSGEITLRDLVRNAMRMRPDRLLVGEVRGPEAIDMLQAINTGHEGSFSTIHANTARDSLTRLEMMVTMGGFDLPLPVIRAYIAAGIRLVVHLMRQQDGARRISRVSELVGVQEGVYHLEDIYRFEHAKPSDTGHLAGRFVCTGHVPEFLQNLPSSAFLGADDLFSPGTIGEVYKS